MRLVWKLFCSMVMITVLACSVGGFVLVDAQFRTSMEREVSALYEENDLLRYALAQELKLHPLASREELAQTARSISITTGQKSVVFRLSGTEGTTIGSSGTLPMPAAPLTSTLRAGQRGWELTTLSDSRIYLHAASSLVLSDGTIMFLENCREVGELFNTREEQYRSFFILMLGLTLAVGVLSLAASSMLLRPLVSLSRATRRMAAGELNQRVRVASNDELGRLSADFNAMAAQLESQVKQLTDAAQRQEDFISSFAHEIKTPLTSIIGYADLLRSRSASPDLIQESVGYIFSEGRRLEALSRKLMDLIVLDKQDFPLRPISMADFLRRVGGSMVPTLKNVGIQLTINAEPAHIPLEPDLMETVCLNLLDNARKSIDGTGEIALIGQKIPEGYSICVMDTGKGIPREELSRVTEAFYMVDKSRARAQGGAGLGLALCQRIVELHKGRMEFKSSPGEGTQVLIYLKGGDGH